MPPELRSLTAKFLHGRTLVRGPKSCADRHQRPSPCGCWGRGDSAHTSLLNFPSHFGLAAAFKDMRPIQEFHVNIAPFTGTTNSFLWDPALPPGGHQKQLFASKLPGSSESHPLLHLFIPAEEENKGQGCRKYCWHRPLQSCQALGGSSHPAVGFAFLVLPGLHSSFLPPFSFQNQLEEQAWPFPTRSLSHTCPMLAFRERAILQKILLWPKPFRAYEQSPSRHLQVSGSASHFLATSAPEETSRGSE